MDLEELNKQLDGRVRTDVLLAPLSTMKIGGKAQYYFEALTDEDLILSYKACRTLKLPFTILGGISNVVIESDPIKGLVVKNRNSYKKIIEDNNHEVIIQIGSGYIVNALVRETVETGLSGFEYQLGLPGTIGGALVMNSKWTHPISYMGDNIVSMGLIDRNGEFKEVGGEYAKFSYGYSFMQETHEVIVWAKFKLIKLDKHVLSERSQSALQYRKDTQPIGLFTSGCIFKNENGVSAGRLIDEAGLKKKKIGGMFVSDKHANFFINDGSGTAKDLEELIAFVTNEVKSKSHITLKKEVITL